MPKPYGCIRRLNLAKRCDVGRLVARLAVLHRIYLFFPSQHPLFQNLLNQYSRFQNSLFQCIQAAFCFPRKLSSALFNQFTNNKFKFPGVFIVALLGTGCGGHVYHLVEPGETLYSISWAYGYDYHEVAAWNGISPPYVVKKGQKLRVAKTKRQSSGIIKTNKNKAIPASAGAGKNRSRKADKQTGKRSTPAAKLVWRWPIKKGKVIQTFDARNPAKQGLDVSGKFGQPVYSAEAGRVVYSGGGLNHYGKLIIVKHNETFLSAYAHNKRLLVREGALLKSGQLIAEMGNTGTNATKLHFEIRRNGKPVNPLRYLPKR
jgi:lipoprotein NlpD